MRRQGRLVLAASLAVSALSLAAGVALPASGPAGAAARAVTGVPLSGTGVARGLPPGWTPIEDGQPVLPSGVPSSRGGPGTTPPGGVSPGSSGSAEPAGHGVAGAGQGPAGAGKGPAAGCRTAAGTIMSQAPGSGRTIALTFDDGPSPYTAAVLKVLAAQHVHATFFMLGAAVRADPATVARVAAEGHLIGNHTWDHAYPRTVRHGWTTAYLTDQLTRTAAAVIAASGRPTCFFRPPGGFMPATVRVVTGQLGEQVALWSVDPQDWAVQGAGNPGAAGTAAQARRIVAAVTAGPVQPHPLVLLHDGGGYRGGTVAALSRIIAYFRAQGYRFVRLDGRT